MAGLENLFAAEPTLPNVQTTKLPDNPQEWAEVITTKLKERFPETANIPLTVEFRKKDDQSGTAIGAIHCESPETGKKLAVPFIIRKFEMFPLDIWMETKTQAVHPLTNDTFKEEFFSSSPAQGLDKRPADSAGQYFNDPSLWTTNYPPLQGRYSYASAGYPLLDLISDSISAEDQKVLRQTIEQNPEMLISFKKHGHVEILQKLLQKTASEKKSLSERALATIPTAVVSVKKHGDKYSILSVASELFDLAASEYLDRRVCMERLQKLVENPEGLLTHVDESGEKMLINKAPKNGVWLFEEPKYKPEAAETFAVYTVTNKSGVMIEGLVIPHVVDFAGKKLSQKIFLSPTHSTMQVSIAGVKKDDKESKLKLEMLKARAARVGETGCFVHLHEGKAIATIPVTLTAIQEYGPMTAVKLDGTKIQISRGFAGHQPYSTAVNEKSAKGAPTFLDFKGMTEVRPHEYVIPLDMLWVPMAGFQEISETPSEWTTKEASHHMEINPLTVRYTGIVYSTTGGDYDRNEFNERELKVVLASQGATESQCNLICKTAKARGKISVHGLAPLRKKATIVKEAQDLEAQLHKMAASVKQNLIKVAAEIEDSTTVDVLLGLNFLNAENLVKFVSYRPVFEKVLDYLAELLLASRLGLKDVNNGAASTAMSRLQEVVDGLERIEAGLKKPGAKTASAKECGYGKDECPRCKKSPCKCDKKQWKAPVLQAKAEAERKEHEAHEKRESKTKEKKEPKGEFEREYEKSAAAPAQPEVAAMASPGGHDPFANGMVDGEMGTHLYLDKARQAGGKALLAYMNGKRTAELNKAQGHMALGIMPKGVKPQGQPGQKAGAKK